MVAADRKLTCLIYEQRAESTLASVDALKQFCRDAYMEALEKKVERQRKRIEEREARVAAEKAKLMEVRYFRVVYRTVSYFKQGTATQKPVKKLQKSAIVNDTSFLDGISVSSYYIDVAQRHQRKRATV